jgi:Prolyl oligopeptidase, N-terminal beta-propeller domain
MAFAQTQAPKAPPTRQDDFSEVIHGVEIIDPYRWLEDQESPETRQWIDAQNRFTHGLLDGLPSRPLIHNPVAGYSSLIDHPIISIRLLCKNLSGRRSIRAANPCVDANTRTCVLFAGHCR